MIDKKAIEESGHRRAHQPSRAETKSHLRNLVANSSVNRARNAQRIVKYGASSFTRNIWLSIAATLVMTVTLLILMITVAASLVLNSTAETMREKIDITIFFQPGTSDETLKQLSDIMIADSNVRTVETASSLAEYENFLKDNADNAELQAALNDAAMRELMLSTMQATMRVKVYDPNNLSGVKGIVETNEVFQANLDDDKQPTYAVNQAEIETINSWASIAKNGGLILGAVFLVISILVIFNTIRMAIFSRREEIYMEKLVGADTSFIRGPFLVEAQICGLIAGVLASTLGLLGYRALAPNLSSYGIDISSVARLMDTNLLVAVYGVMIGVGILVGTISARLAIHKYLK